MIARQWIGETRESDSDAYLKYLEETGVKECKAVKGNQGVWLLRRVHDGKAEFVFISLWDSFESVKAFAGPARKGRLLSRGQEVSAAARSKGHPL